LNQLRGPFLTQQRFNPVVVRNLVRSADYFLHYFCRKPGDRTVSRRRPAGGLSKNLSPLLGSAGFRQRHGYYQPALRQSIPRARDPCACAPSCKAVATRSLRRGSERGFFAGLVGANEYQECLRVQRGPGESVDRGLMWEGPDPFLSWYTELIHAPPTLWTKHSGYRCPTSKCEAPPGPEAKISLKEVARAAPRSLNSFPFDRNGRIAADLGARKIMGPVALCL